MASKDINLLAQENEDLNKEVLKLKKAKTGWMVAAILSFSLFAITLALKLS